MTPEGEGALQLGSVGLLNAAGEAYRRWREENPRKKVDESEETVLEGQDVSIAYERNSAHKFGSD